MPNADPTPARTLQRGNGASIAYRTRPGKSDNAAPGVLFCGGFNSHMQGSKATFLDQFCESHGLAYTRFDYQGHGESSGDFADGTIGEWADDALAILDAVATGPQLVVGSSMGAWIAMLLARARPETVSALVLIAPGPDFPTKLLWPALPQSAQDAIRRHGQWLRPSEFEDERYPITKKLIEESSAHNLLDGDPVAFDGPVRILHGDRDEVVPVEHALKTAGAIRSKDIVTSIVKGGDHRLSAPAHLTFLENTIRDILK